MMDNPRLRLRYQEFVGKLTQVLQSNPSWRLIKVEFRDSSAVSLPENNVPIPFEKEVYVRLVRASGGPEIYTLMPISLDQIIDAHTHTFNLMVEYMARSIFEAADGVKAGSSC